MHLLSACLHPGWKCKRYTHLHVSTRILAKIRGYTCSRVSTPRRGQMRAARLHVWPRILRKIRGYPSGFLICNKVLGLSPKRRSAETASLTNMVSRTKERALDPLLVPALPALATPSICWLRSAAASDTLAQHPCSSTAVRATAGCSAIEPQSSQILRAALPLAPSQPYSPWVMPGRV